MFQTDKPTAQTRLPAPDRMTYLFSWCLIGEWEVPDSFKRLLEDPKAYLKNQIKLTNQRNGRKAKPTVRININCQYNCHFSGKHTTLTVKVLLAQLKFLFIRYFLEIHLLSLQGLHKQTNRIKTNRCPQQKTTDEERGGSEEREGATRDKTFWFFFSWCWSILCFHCFLPVFFSFLTIIDLDWLINSLGLKSWPLCSLLCLHRMSFITRVPVDQVNLSADCTFVGIAWLFDVETVLLMK